MPVFGGASALVRGWGLQGRGSAVAPNVVPQWGQQDGASGVGYLHSREASSTSLATGFPPSAEGLSAVLGML
ncbi:hypothetical protein L345_16588 [Ophiophagus hannah]|uniref:Uncharacterized protein n=1 Tax=Ophiophagus hannah TaxID=8665 RepID=V8N712_OPHHA|nr:hypothetical protein L345_16588 [Ophiophagus hannah]